MVDAILRQAEALCAQKGETRAMIEFRKHGLWYMARFSGVRTLKVRMSGVTRLTELQAKKFTSTLGAMFKSSGMDGDINLWLQQETEMPVGVLLEKVRIHPGTGQAA